jgi:phospholipase/carboxylesterase
MREGKPIAASLQHLVFYPDVSREEYPAIVALHGRGADAPDLLPLVQAIGLDDALVIAPRAPLAFNFGGGYAWYDLGEEAMPDSQTLRSGLAMLQKFLIELKEGYPISTQQLLLLGFSQGTVMSYAVGLLKPNPIRRIVALSGYIPHRSGLPLELHNLGGMDVFISHGAYDEIIPVKYGRESAEMLSRAGANVVYREYAMGHEVSQETLRDLSVWMRKTFQD